MPSMIIVTAADAGFFELLRGLLTSIEAQRADQAVALGVFDLGLTREQRAWVEGRASTVIEPGWDLELPAQLRADQPHIRGLTARPFLPRYFPGHDIYIWIDADVWLQDWRGIELYALGAARGCLIAAVHTDRAYHLQQGTLRVRHDKFRLGYGESLASELILQHHLNAGIFAAPADSPLWQDWAAIYQEGIDASEGQMISDQAALNVTYHRRRLPIQVLPAIFNWQCHLALPMWDPLPQKFCEPMLPHLPISMLHMTHNTKHKVFEIRGLDGRSRRMRLCVPESRAPAMSQLTPST